MRCARKSIGARAGLLLAVALVVPAHVQAGEKVTVLVTGRIATTGTLSLVEKAKFVADECKQNYLDGISVALIDVSEYRGRTVRIRPLGPETTLEKPVMLALFDVSEGMECLSLDPTRTYRSYWRGAAWQHRPLDLVIRGVYLQISSVIKEHVYEHFQIELIEFT